MRRHHRLEHDDVAIKNVHPDSKREGRRLAQIVIKVVRKPFRMYSGTIFKKKHTHIFVSSSYVKRSIKRSILKTLSDVEKLSWSIRNSKADESREVFLKSDVEGLSLEEIGYQVEVRRRPFLSLSLIYIYITHEFCLSLVDLSFTGAFGTFSEIAILQMPYDSSQMA